MLIHSELALSFQAKALHILKRIIKEETNLELARTRIKYQGYTFPINIEIFEGLKLGYFDSQTYAIGLNIFLSYNVKDNVLKNIIRHELAHLITNLYHPNHLTPHGDEFKSVCHKLKWNESISKSTMYIELENNKVGLLEQEKIINKVKKLLSLASSDNRAESESALIKAQKLMIKYNIDQIKKDDSQFIFYTKVLHSQKKRDAKLVCLYDIIGTFFVKLVLSYGKSEVRLQATGTKDNIQLASYIYDYLTTNLDQLWSKAKSDEGLKGLKDKNSFFRGVAQGYVQKINTTQKEFKSDIIVINQQLDDAVNKIYKRLSSTSSSTSSTKRALELGMIAGKNMNIKPAIKTKNKIIKLLGGTKC